MGFKTILADPPWNYSLYSAKGEAKSPQAHYQCLDIEEIKRLPVSDVADRNCVLFLWATNPLLDQAFEVITAWGFRYVTKIEWVKMTNDGRKPRLGTGYRVLGATEPLLIATRGDDTFCPPAGTRLPGVILAPKTRHSAKPCEQWRYVEQYPGPYLEMFARSTRDGWTSLGNEIDGLDIREALERIRPQLSLFAEVAI